MSKAFALGTLQTSGYDQFAIARAASGSTPPSIAIYGTSTSPLMAIPVTGTIGVTFSVASSVLSLSAGDLDGDGYGDLMIGQSPANSPGQVYVRWLVLKPTYSVSLEGTLATSSQPITASGTNLLGISPG